MGLFGKKKVMDSSKSGTNAEMPQVIAALNFCLEYSNDDGKGLVQNLLTKLTHNLPLDGAEYNQLIPFLRIYARRYAEIPQRYPDFIEKFPLLYQNHNAELLTRAIERYYLLSCPGGSKNPSAELHGVVLKKLEELSDSMIQPKGAVSAPQEAPENAAPASSSGPALPASALRCAWQDDDKTAQFIKSIKNTWFVDVAAYDISDADSKALEGAYPRDTSPKQLQAQYAIEQSSNSIFWHAYGSWLDFGYAKFLYNGKLYYINVAPMVHLTQSMYDRMSELDHMAKIFLCLMDNIKGERNNVLFVLEGTLGQ